MHSSIGASFCILYFSHQVLSPGVGGGRYHTLPFLFFCIIYLFPGHLLSRVWLSVPLSSQPHPGWLFCLQTFWTSDLFPLVAFTLGCLLQSWRVKMTDQAQNLASSPNCLDFLSLKLDYFAQVLLFHRFHGPVSINAILGTHEPSVRCHHNV